MKGLKCVCLVLLLTLGLAAAFGDPIADAMTDAELDAQDYRAKGWGALAFGASTLVSPLLGGGSVILAANLMEPDIDVPPRRLAAAQEEYGNDNDLLLYRAQYQDSMATPIQADRSRRAWIGTGIGFGVRLVVVAAYVYLYIGTLTAYGL